MSSSEETQAAIDKILPKEIRDLNNSEGDIARKLYDMFIKSLPNVQAVNAIGNLLKIEPYQLEIAMQLRYLKPEDRKRVLNITRLQDDNFAIIHDYIMMKENYRLQKQLDENGTLNTDEPKNDNNDEEPHNANTEDIANPHPKTVVKNVRPSNH